jgi:hypothetical protein
MDALRKASAYLRGSRDPSSQMELPKCVERAYVLGKDSGHRGPVIGGYLTTGFEDIQLASTVTPSGLTVVRADSGSVLSQLKPDDGDAFTSSCLVRLRLESEPQDRLCGLAIGTQAGSIILVELASSVRVIASCKTNVSAITCLGIIEPSIILAGTLGGNLLLYDPIHHPETPSVSVGVSSDFNAVTAVCPVSLDGRMQVWVAIDKEGIILFDLQSDSAGVNSMSRCALEPIQHERMRSITSMAPSSAHRLMLCLSACDEVLLIDMVTHELVQRYPAALMTCGSALSSIAAVELPTAPGSTFLFLGGIDGSLSMRELSRRQKDMKLQCILHRCIDSLTPHDRNITVERPDPSGGCPITSVSVSDTQDACVVGDASCALYVIPLQLRTLSRASSHTGSDLDEENCAQTVTDQRSLAEDSCKIVSDNV